MKNPRTDELTWIWYAVESEVIPVEPGEYPSLKRKDGIFPWPDWVCRMPNDGLHLRMEFSRIDVHIEREPNKKDEIASTSFSVKIVQLNWFEKFSVALERDSFKLGDVMLGKEVIKDWKTIVTRNTPRLRRQKEIFKPPCPVCGSDDFAYHVGGKYWLDERDETSDKIMVTTHGIFLRQDVVERNAVPVPRGAFRRPSKLRFEKPK